MALTKVGKEGITGISNSSDATAITIDSSENVGVGTTTPGTFAAFVSGSTSPGLVVAGTQPCLVLSDTDISGSSSTLGITKSGDSTLINNLGGGNLDFYNNGGHRSRIDSSGNFLHGKTSADFSTAGTHLYANGEVNIVKSGVPLYVNRLSSNGTVIAIAKDAVTQGQIDVSGTTVTYNGGHLGRWSQATDGKRIDGLVKGTVMTNLDQMAVWSHDEVLWTEDDDLPEGVSVGDVRKAAFTEDNEQLNCMAVSSVEGDVNVAGCFIRWDEDDQVHTNDMTVAMTGDFVIRIAKETTVARGDLLMSAGDGTAKPQGDDIVRSKTIAKVTSTTKSHTYDDGSYLVPCVLMAC